MAILAVFVLLAVIMLVCLAVISLPAARDLVETAVLPLLVDWGASLLPMSDFLVIAIVLILREVSKDLYRRPIDCKQRAKLRSAGEKLTKCMTL